MKKIRRLSFVSLSLSLSYAAISAAPPPPPPQQLLQGYWQKTLNTINGGKLAIGSPFTQFNNEKHVQTATDTTLLLITADHIFHAVLTLQEQNHDHFGNPEMDDKDDVSYANQSGQPYTYDATKKILTAQQVLTPGGGLDADAEVMQITKLDANNLVCNILLPNWAVPPTDTDTYVKVTADAAKQIVANAQAANVSIQMPDNFF